MPSPPAADAAASRSDRPSNSDSSGGSEGEADMKSEQEQEQSQEAAIRHRAGPLLLLGEPGTGKSEALARRLVRLAGEGDAAPDRVLLIAATRPGAERLRTRAESLLEGPYDELWIGTWDAIGERLLREHSDEAGLDPFFDVLGPAERLAMLLDRVDELPL